MNSAFAEDIRKNEGQPAEKSQNNVMVKTSRFGDLIVETDKIITMTSPFLGFPESKCFFLQPHGPDSPFMWFQSLDEPDLAFVVIHPAAINQEYKPELTKSVKEELQLNEGQGFEFLLILTIPKNNPQEMTANLLGPIAFNVKKRLAKQVLLDPAKYDCSWPVFQSGAGNIK